MDDAMSDARWLTREDAARHVSLSTVAFSRRVRLGVLPAGVSTLGHLRWDRMALDAAMTGGIIPANREDAVDAIAAEIRAGASNRAKAPGRRHDQRVSLRARAG